jgi:transposase
MFFTNGCIEWGMEREDARKLSPEAQHERRVQVIRAYKRGVNRRQIAREFGLSYSSVRMIVNRFKQDGLRGIESGRRGRPAGSCRTLTPKQEEQIQRMISDKRPEQLKLDFALWTRAAVMLLIERECTVRILLALTRKRSFLITCRPGLDGLA